MKTRTMKKRAAFLFLKGSGDVLIEDRQHRQVWLKNCPAGGVLPIRPARILKGKENVLVLDFRGKVVY